MRVARVTDACGPFGASTPREAGRHVLLSPCSAAGLALPTEELVYADFYVPLGNIYIDCWEAEHSARELSGRFRKRELYKELDLRHLEINSVDGDTLDEVLGRGLLGFGIRC